MITYYSVYNDITGELISVFRSMMDAQGFLSQKGEGFSAHEVKINKILIDTILMVYA